MEDPEDYVDPNLAGTSTARGLSALLHEFVDWLRPKGRVPRNVTVPDLTGLRLGKARLAAMRSGVKIRVVRLVDPPAPVEGVVVDQRPPAGTRVCRHSIVTLSVFHEPRERRL